MCIDQIILDKIVNSLLVISLKKKNLSLRIFEKTRTKYVIWFWTFLLKKLELKVTKSYLISKIWETQTQGYEKKKIK
jgi:hypothetical protein